MIPRSKLAKIYAEMFVTDQWIQSKPGLRTIADTSLVYEPILAKYGYDKLDYIHSVDFYVNDPERFARILRSSMDKLDKRIAHLLKVKRQQELADEAAKTLERFKMDYTFEEYFPYMADEPYVHYYDSLAFEADSLMVYRLVAIETADTLYDRLEMIVRTDSLSVCDTLPLVDTVVTPRPQELKKKLEEMRNASPARKIVNLSNNNKLWQLSE